MIPGWGTKIQHAAWCDRLKKKKKKQLSESEDVSVNNKQTRLELKLKRMIELKRISTVTAT